MVTIRVILEDSRQKPEKNAHIRKQLEALGYKVDRSKLYVGDYQFADSGKLVVDTKQDLQEVVGNVVQQHERFKAECVRAQEAGIQLVILIADPKITCLADVFSWKNPRRIYSKKATTGATLAKIMYTFQEKYGVQFEFAHPDHIGEKIVSLLGGDGNGG